MRDHDDLLVGGLREAADRTREPQPDLLIPPTDSISPKLPAMATTGTLAGQGGRAASSGEP
jgi:hypothetical protein